MKQKHVGIQKVVSVLLLVALLLTFATPAFAEGGPAPNKADPIPVIPKPSPPGIVQKTITKFPSFEDANWPIIRVERSTYTDENGILHKRVTIIRENPLDSPQIVQCGQVSAETVSGTCQYVAQVSQLDADSAGGVTSYQKHYADKYKCPGGDCVGGGTYIVNFYKMTRVENWWTRSNTNLVVWNADFLWGCTGNCFECTTGSAWQYTYHDPLGSPGWNGTQSWTYIYSSSGWPIWAGSIDISFLVGARMSSESSGGSLYVQTAWMN